MMARLSLIIFAIALVSVQCAFSQEGTDDRNGLPQAQQNAISDDNSGMPNQNYDKQKDSDPANENELTKSGNLAPAVPEPVPPSTEPTTTTTSTATTTAAPIKINNSSTPQVVLLSNQATQPTSTTTKKPQAAASVVDSNNNKVAEALASAPASTAKLAFVCMAAIVGVCVSFVLPLLREQ